MLVLTFAPCTLTFAPLLAVVVTTTYTNNYNHHQYFQYIEGFVYWDPCKETDNIKTDKLVSLGNVYILYSVDKVC